MSFHITSTTATTGASTEPANGAPSTLTVSTASNLPTGTTAPESVKH